MTSTLISVSLPNSIFSLRVTRMSLGSTIRTEASASAAEDPGS